MITIRMVPARISLTPEMARMMQIVNDPQDLNEALFSVAVDEATARMISDIEAEIIERLAEEVCARAFR